MFRFVQTRQKMATYGDTYFRCRSPTCLIIFATLTDVVVQRCAKYIHTMSISVPHTILEDMIKPTYLLQLKDMHFLRSVLADDPVVVKPNQLRSAWPRRYLSYHLLTAWGLGGFGSCYHWMPWIAFRRSVDIRDGHSTPKKSKFWTVVGDSKSFVCAPFPWGETVGW